MAYKMKGHTLPGINQRSEGNTDLPDGRSASAALQYRSPAKDTKTDPDYDKDHQKEYEHIDYGGGDVRHKAKSPAKDASRDWAALATQAEKEGADAKTVKSMKEKARHQKSAKEYVKTNPDAERVNPYATGEKTVSY